MVWPVVGAIYTLTMNELRKMGTKAALKEIAKRTAKNKKLKKEGLNTAKSKTKIADGVKVTSGANISKFLKRRNTLASNTKNMSGVTRTKPKIPPVDEGLKAAESLGVLTLGAGAGYGAGQMSANTEKKKTKFAEKTDKGQKPSNLHRKTAAQKFKDRYGK